MRVSPIGWIHASLEETLAEAKRSAEVTHNHPEGIKGAQAIAACVFLARIGKNKEEIKEYIKNNNIKYFFISGDLYEHKYVRQSTIEYINKLFKEGKYK